MNDAPDVGGILGPERILDIAADDVEFEGDLLDIRTCQMQVGRHVGDRHGRCPRVSAA